MVAGDAPFGCQFARKDQPNSPPRTHRRGPAPTPPRGARPGHIADGNFDDDADDSCTPSYGYDWRKPCECA